jgi:type I restriction enzyme, S subunit
MEVRKNKTSHIGIFPSDWLIKKLKEVGTFSKGQGVRKDDAQSGSIPCIRYGELYTHHNEVIKKYNSFISKEVAKTSKRLKCGDILFAGSGETKEEIGKCAAFVDKNLEAYAGSDIVILTPKDADSTLLGYLLNSPLAVRQKASKGQGDAVVHISATNLGEISIPLPPTKAEQTAIATALSDTDALITSLEKLIAKKRNIKQGAMQELLTGRRKLLGFPGVWARRTLGDLGHFKNGINKAKNDFGFGFPFVNLMDVFGFPVINSKRRLDLINANTTERKMYDLKKGDVLFIRSSVKPEGVGLTSLIEENLENTVFSGFLIRYRESAHLDYQFKKYCFYEESFRHRLMDSSTVSANTNINQESLKKIVFSYPIDQSEQRAIAKILSDLDSELTSLQSKLKKLQEIKGGMMQSLLTGKIRLV